MANIARLGVALGLNSAEFVTGLQAASRKLDHFATASVGVAKNAVLALGAALSVATYKAVAYADEIADVAAANDIAIDSIIKLTNVLENSGGKGQNAGKMIASFTDFVDKAAKGSFEGQKTFNDLGISIKDIGNMSTQDLLLKTTQAIAGIADPLTRNARAADAFGKAAKGVDMVDFAKGLKEGKGATLEQEKAIKDAAEAFDLFKSAGRDISLLITETLGPSLLKLGKYLKDLDISNLSFTIFGKFIGFGTGNDPTIRIVELSKEIAELGKQRELALGRPLVISTIDREILALQREQDALIAIQKIQAEKYSDKNQKTEADEPKRQVILGVDPKAKAAADMLRQKGFELDKARMASDLAKEDKFLSERLKIDLEYKRKTAEANQERFEKDTAEENKFKLINESILNNKLFVIKQEYEEKKKTLVFKNMAEQAAEEIASAEEARIATANLNAFYSEGNTSIKEKQELDKTALTRAQEMFKLERQGIYLKAEELQQEKELLEQQWKYADAVAAITAMKNLDSMSRMEALAREEKLNEKALQNILERTRMLKAEKSGSVFDGFIFRAQTFGKDMETSFEAGGKAFDSLMSNMSNGLEEFVKKGELDFNKFAESIIKDMLAIQLRASATNLFSMLAKAVFSPSVSLAEPFAGPKADGGPVESNNSYLVGERGPELFVPRSAGAIVPNHSMAMMGGSTNITNYNIQAIDTKSFEDRILGSSKAVWAANAYGAKNLALGRGRT